MSADEYEAVLFCSDGKIVREMMHAEFEAILDSFVPLQEYAGQEVKAIYVCITPQIKVAAAVYFLIGFDGAGNADAKWNVPLRQLADEGEPGPNLGAGPIRLSCRSQCPVSWHEQHLWDPGMDTDPNDFVILRDVVKRNKLAFKKIELEEEVPMVDEAPEAEAAPAAAAAQSAGQPLILSEDISDSDKVLASSLIQFLRKKLTSEYESEKDDIDKKHRLLLAAQKTQFEDELSKIENDHSVTLRESSEKMQELHNKLTAEQERNEKLAKELDSHAEGAASAQQLFEQKLAESKEVGSNEVELLKENMAAEMQRQIETIHSEFQEQLAAKDMELVYRNEEKQSLDEEVEKLHSERAVLISQGGEQFLNRLRENNVSFVVYHSGAGHINIEMDEIGDYLENPMAFAASKCEVDEETYRLWLKHQDSLACGHMVESKGETCGKKLRPVPHPSQFVPGRSDRCPLHWSFGDDGAAAE